MTTGERIFFFILALRFIAANPVPLDFPFIPKTNCYDLNSNGFPDFIAVGNTELPRTLYHLDSTPKGIEVLWEYSLPEDKNAYFVDIIVGDFNDDQVTELIALTYQDNGKDIFYIFSADGLGFYGDIPLLSKLKYASTEINNPRRLYEMTKGVDNKRKFILTQGSPNRSIIICEYRDGEIIQVDTLGKEFIKNTMAPIDIALGDFNGDAKEDIFLLNNGPKPAGYIIFSDGTEEALDLSNFPRLRFLHEKGVDLNFDDSDEIVMVNRNGELMSDIWGTNSIPLSEKEIQKILINPDNGIVYLTGISKSGKVGNYSIDPLTRTVLSSDFELPQFQAAGFTRIYSLSTSNHIIITHNESNPELWSMPKWDAMVTEMPPPILTQRIYYREPDYVINSGELFTHAIEGDSLASFLNFTGENLPEGMDFNLEKVQLEWLPTVTQLGYHEISYTLELRKKGDLELDSHDGKKIVNQNESIVTKNYSYLTYVNDPFQFKNTEDKRTIVNRDLFEWTIPIKDNNADTRLSVKKIKGEIDAVFRLVPPEIILVPIDTVEIPVDTVVIDTGLVKPEIPQDTIVVEPEEPTYIDTVQTEFEGFAEDKLESEKDPFKKKKQEESLDQFKSQEQEYQEKLKTHVKIVEDGKNIWVPKDSIAAVEDTTLIGKSEITLSDTLETTEEVPDTLTIEDGILDTLIVENVIPDTMIAKDEIEEIATIDTSYLEISYSELIKHQSEFYWTPRTDPGNYNFTLTGTDEFSSDTIEITLTVHPEINLNMNHTQFTATIEKPFNTAISVKQTPPHEPYQYQLIRSPENMHINNAGEISWIPLPTQVDDYNFEVEVSDGIAVSTLHYNIYVNAPPVISSRPPEIFNIQKNEELNYQFESFDLNTDPQLNWKLLTGPKEMTLNEQGILNWTGNNLGHHGYKIQLSDGIDFVNWQAAIYVNTPPVFTSIPITITAEGELYEYQITAVDENETNPSDSTINNELSFILIQNPKGMIIDENQILRWETGNNPTGDYPVAIVASDGADETLQEFQLYINSLPIITSADSITIQIGDTLDFQIEAYDLNADDTLSYHLDTLISGMNLDTKAGRIYWIPSKLEIGLHTFILNVKDGHGDYGTALRFKIFVYIPPKLTVDLATEAFSGLEYSVFITAEDMYGEKLSKPEAVQIESATFFYFNLSEYAHQFKWTPREVDKGDQEMVIKLTDDHGFTTNYTHKFRVLSNPCIHCDQEEEAVPPDTTGN